MKELYDIDFLMPMDWRDSKIKQISKMFFTNKIFIGKNFITKNEVIENKIITFKREI